MLAYVDSFKHRLQIALDVREVKPSELSRRTGISQSTISQYRSGYAEPKKDRLSVIAKALSVNPSWLMGLDVDMDIFPEEEKAPAPERDEREREIMEIFEKLPDKEKEKFVQLARLLAKE